MTIIFKKTKMKKIRVFPICLLIIFQVLFASCDSYQTEQPLGWIVLDNDEATKEGNVYSWDFDAVHTGKFNVQVLTEDTLSKTTVLARVKINNWEYGNKLRSNFIIKLGNKILTVSNLGVIDFKTANAKSLSLTIEAPFEQVRIVPNERNSISSGKFKTEWEAMHNSPEKEEALTWFNEAKFGMFIHWGLYSQLGGIWQGVKIEDSPYSGPRVAEWIMSTFQISRAAYKELIKTFSPNKSFAKHIAHLAKQTGMKYMVITTKHHDGFALYKSSVSDFDIENTPYDGDLIKELYDACQEEGIAFGVYYSHGNDWQDGADSNNDLVMKRNNELGINNSNMGKNIWDPSSNTYEEYLENKAYPQVEELLQLLPNLKLIWFDGASNITEEQSFRFYKMAYDINPNVLVNRRVGCDFGDYLDMGDNVVPTADEKPEKQWETCGTTNNSWGYKLYDTDFKSSQELLYWFVDIISKGGNYLLNIGPDGKGHVPEPCVTNMLEMGKWVQTNADAIYGTSSWKIFSEGGEETKIKGTDVRKHKGFNREFTSEDFWFTAKGDKVYAMCLTSVDGTINIKSWRNSNGKVASIRVLGSDAKLKWQQTDEGLKLDL